MMDDDPFGPVEATLRRSARGLVSALVLFAVGFGGLALWNLLIRPGPRAEIALLCLGVTAIIGAGLIIRSPRRVLVRWGGLVVQPYAGAPRRFAWEQIDSANLFRAPLGRQPLCVFVHRRDGNSLLLSSAEFHDVGLLADAIRSRLKSGLNDEVAGC